MSVLPAMTLPVPATEVEMTTRTAPYEVRSEDYLPITDSENVEKFVKAYFADIPLMARIAKCESRNRHLNKHGQILRGEKTPLDRGVMQINLYFHQDAALKMGLDLHDLDDNVAYARYLYEKYGAKPWMSSSACWAKFGSEIAKR